MEQEPPTGIFLTLLDTEGNPRDLVVERGLTLSNAMIITQKLLSGSPAEYSLEDGPQYVGQCTFTIADQCLDFLDKVPMDKCPPYPGDNAAPHILAYWKGCLAILTDLRKQRLEQAVLDQMPEVHDD